MENETKAYSRKTVAWIAFAAFALGFAFCALWLGRYREMEKTGFLMDRWTKNIYDQRGNWLGRIK